MSGTTGFTAAWKQWLTREARRIRARREPARRTSRALLLATALHGRAGDVGAFVTASEWLDVNYGDLVRKLLLGPLGGTSVHILDPAALPFPDADTTATITTFAIRRTPRGPEAAAGEDAGRAGAPRRRTRGSA